MSGEEVAAAAAGRRGEDSPGGEGPSGRELPLWCSFAVVAGVFAALAAWSWGKWTDVHIDFGAELYIPWRITEGDVLYRDIAYRHGPLSHNANALFFSLFGVSLRTLVFCNLAILAGICGLILRLFRQAFGRATATAVCCAFLAVFGFSQYVGISNYNYVTPYLHAQTHGLALSLAMMVVLLEALQHRSHGWSALAGFCFGCVLLTKAELAGPAAVSAGVGFFLIAASGDARWTHGASALSIFVAAALLPVAAFYGFLRLQMPANLALGGVLGNWHSLGSDVFEDAYYRRGAGLDDVSANLRRAFAAFAGLTFATAAALVGDWAFRVRRHRGLLAAIAGCGVLALLLVRPALVSWAWVLRALPLTSLIAGSVALVLCARARKQREVLLRAAPVALWSVYAFGILGKMMLNVRVSHYGFVLAMPATLLLIACLIAWIPDLLRRRFGRGELFRALAFGAIAAAVVFQLRESNRHYEIKDFRFGRGADAMVVENPRIQSRSRIVTQTLEHLRAIMPPGATLLVLPDGVGINYRLRRENPTRFTLFLPAEFRDLGGQAAVVADLRAHPPDFIVLVHRNHAEFGVGPFGTDPRNGRAITDWVREDYRRIERIGEEPFQGRGFGTVILRRRADPVGEPAGGLPAEALR
jgi:hypothetical protein